MIFGAAKQWQPAPFPWGTLLAVLIIIYYVALTALCAWYCWHVAGLKNRTAWSWLLAGVFFNGLAVVMIGLSPDVKK